MIKYNGKMWEGAVFDLDGTILDSMWIWESVDGRFLANHGLPVEESYLKALTNMNFPQAAAYTKERYAMAESEAAIMEEWYALARGMYEKEIGLKPHAAEYREYLHRRRCSLRRLSKTAESTTISTPLPSRRRRPTGRTRRRYTAWRPKGWGQSPRGALCLRIF